MTQYRNRERLKKKKKGTEKEREGLLLWSAAEDLKPD